MSEDYDDKDASEVTRSEVVEGLKSGLLDVLADVLADARGDVKAYGALLVQEYGRYLWRSIKDHDDMARRNLAHLRAQVALLAVKREIVATRELMARITEIVEVAARVGTKALLAALL